jgi:hypothetical protein
MRAEFEFARMIEQLIAVFSLAYYAGQMAVSQPEIATLGCVMYLTLSHAVRSLRRRS